MSKGRSHHLLRKKLLRDHREEKNRIKEEKEEALLKVIPMKEEIEELKRELLEKEKQLVEYNKDSELLRNLYESGIIDLDGKTL